MKPIEIIGLTGGILNVVAGVPQIVKCLKTEDTLAISWSMMTMVLCGTTLTAIYGLIILQPAVYVSSILSIFEFCILMSLKAYYEIYIPKNKIKLMSNEELIEIIVNEE